MSASATDKITRTRNGARPNSARVTTSRTTGASSLICDNLAGWPTTTGVKFVTYKINTSNQIIAGSQLDCEGTVSSNTINNFTVVDGTDVGHAIGDVVEMLPTANWGDDLATALLNQHSQVDGSHTAITATSVASTGSVSGTTGVFSSDVSDNGVILKTSRSEGMFDYIASGCVLAGTGYGSTLAWTLTSGVVYIGGRRLTVSSASGTVTASKDTYFDLLDPGSGTVATLVNTAGNIVANNAASPALAASSLRLGIIVSGANIAAAASINQGQETALLPIASSIPYVTTDSLGNLICPRDPNRSILGYTEKASGQSAIGTLTDITGMSLTLKVPSNTYSIKLEANASISDTTSGATFLLSIADGSNVSQIERSQIITSANAAALQSVHLQRKIPVTPGSTYTFKLRASSVAGVINNGNTTAKSTTLTVSRA